MQQRRKDTNGQDEPEQRRSGPGKFGGSRRTVDDGNGRPKRGQTERPSRGSDRRRENDVTRTHQTKVRDVRRRSPSDAESVPAVYEPMRIAKALARAGLCSRREAERWILDGRVSVNGAVLEGPAFEVKPSDTVYVDGEALPPAEPPKLWRYYKPKGLVTTHRDPEARPTVFDSLPPDLPRVVSVGRLDFNTEGLLLLTNNGELARHLELPSTGWLRRYRVRARGRITQDELDRLKDGVEIDGIRYGPVEAMIDTVQGANMWLSVGVREGKNREVRRVLASLNLDVNRLIRVSYGPFQLLDLQPGEIGYVRRRVLSDQLGDKFAHVFGLASPDDGEAEKKSPAGPRRGRRKPDGGGRR